MLGVPATGTVRGIPTEVALDRADGMPCPCVLTLDNLTVIRLSLCTERITKLAPERIAEVCQALGHATAC